MMTRSQGQRTLREPSQLQTAGASLPPSSMSMWRVDGRKQRKRLTEANSRPSSKALRYRWAPEVRKQDGKPPRH